MQVLICDVLTLADAGLISQEVNNANRIFQHMHTIMQVKWRILAYGINEQEYGPNMAFFLCSHASLRLLFLAALFTQIISIAGFPSYYCGDF